MKKFESSGLGVWQRKKDELTTIELSYLVSKGVFDKYGTTGRGTYYAVAKAQKQHESSTKGAKGFKDTL